MDHVMFSTTGETVQRLKFPERCGAPGIRGEASRGPSERICVLRHAMITGVITGVIAVALAGVLSVPAIAQRASVPDSALIVTSDVFNFWRAVDSAATTDLMTRLGGLYLEPASVGLRAFIRKTSAARSTWRVRCT